MFETAADLQRTWRAGASRRATPVRSVDRDTLRELEVKRMEAEVLAVLCPDWRNPMLVVDAHSLTVAYANLHAIQMFNRRRPLRVHGSGILELVPADATRRLRARLDDVLANNQEESSLVVDDPEAGTTFAIRMRLPQGFLRDVLERHLDAPGRLAVLDILSRRVVLSQPDMRAFGAAFALTAAELEILTHIGEGLSLAAIAKLRGVQLETVRHQCKRLLVKTRCSRQSELVRLVVALCSRDAHSLGGETSD